jgi:hypothetical protein
MMVGIRNGCGNANGKGGATEGPRRGAYALFEARADEVVEIAVEHGFRVAHFDVRAQILDAALVEHVRADLVAPAHVGLARFELVLLGLALAHLGSYRRDFSMAIASARLRCCERSFWHCTTMPVGMCVIRTAESVLLMCWPPAPRRGRCRCAGRPG